MTGGHFLVVLLCVAGFLAVSVWAQYEWRREQDKDNRHHDLMAELRKVPHDHL